MPLWLFPLYFIVWGGICQLLQPRFILPVFFVTSGIPFVVAFLWAYRIRRYVPYGKFCLLTLIIPFLIFATIGIVMAIGAVVFDMVKYGNP